MGAARHRRRRGVLVLALAALVLAAIGLLLRQACSPRASRPTPKPPPVVANSASSELAEVRAVERTAPTLTNEARTATESLADSGIQVQVVDAASGEPVADATVASFDSDALERSEVLATGYDLEPLLARFGRTTTSGAHGLASVPRPRSRDTVIALSKEPGRERAGARHIETGDPVPIRIEIAPRRDVALLAVDEAARPLVGVRFVVDRSELAEAFGRWRVTTRAPDGLALLSAVDLHFRPLDDPCPERGEGTTSDTIEIRVDAPIAAPDSVWVDRDALPTEPLRFVLPPTGSAEFVLLDSAGDPVERDLLEVVRSWPRRPAGARSTDEGSGYYHYHPVRFDRGLARLEYVEPGVWLDALFEVDGLGTVRGEGPAPAQAGQSCRIELRPDPTGPTLRGTVVGEDSAPIAGATLHMQVVVTRARDDDEEPVPCEAICRTDGNGGFEQFDFLPPNPPLAAKLLIWEAAPAKGVRAGAEIEVPAELLARGGDLGIVRLTDASLLVSGRVLDDRGDPVGDHVVEASRIGEDGREEFGLGVPFERDDERATSDREGHFELHGFVGPGELEVELDCMCHEQRDDLHCAAGTSGVILIADRGGSISGSVRLDPFVPAESIEIVVLFQPRAGRDASKGPWSTWARLNRRGGFVKSGLPPCDATVSVVAGGFGQEVVVLAEVDGVRVGAGDATADPRLQGIDLGGLISRTRMEVVGPDGAPVAEVRIHSLFEPREGLEYRYDLQRFAGDGTTQMTWIAPAPDVELFAPGLRVQRLRLEPGDQRVELARATRIRVTLPIGDFALPARTRFVAGCAASGATEWQAFGDAEPLDTTGSTTIAAPTTGSMEVHIGIERYSDWSSEFTEITLLRTALPVAEADELLELSLTLTDAIRQEILAAIER